MHECFTFPATCKIIIFFLHYIIPEYPRGVPCWSIWAIILTPVFDNSKILHLKQYFTAIKYYHKHLQEKSGGSAIAQFTYDATPL